MEYKILTCGVLLIISLLSIRLSKKVKVPLLIMFLFIGMLAGSEGIGGIYFDDAAITQNIGNFALIFILFSGALETKKEDVKAALYPSGILATAGVFLTAVFAGLFTYFLTNFTLVEAFLFGAIVSSTDAAAVISMLGDSNLKKRIKSVIEIESGSNDPMAYALILFIMSMVKADGMTIIGGIIFLIRQLVVGAAFGFLFGKLTLPIGKLLKIEREEFLTIHMIAMLFICFSVTNILKGNGFLAIYLMGILVGNQRFGFRLNTLRNLRVISWLMQISMFIILGLLVFPSQLIKFMLVGSVLAILITLVSRMAVVYILLSKFRYTNKEKFFMGWAGLKGAVPIIFSTMAITEGIENSQTMFNLVFYIVVFSVLIQGMTLKPLAKFLKLVDKKEDNEATEIDLEELEELSIKKLYIEKNSEYVDKSIKDISFPKSMHIISIRRENMDIIPNGDVILRAGDKLLMAGL
ncbi:potassium/proton antiporter [Fusobacterium hominis]|uniref:Potassium/proton antiporter n=1 Tax=Fusobacterium hominis TaxID=2764326 RepID=A0A7G9GUR4_9FUSO|nr:potassium/proton antiporter [Fusobacterium hominis]QNM14546.1 potassium/proton antiporter [Fusobacterium hominis]